MRTLDSARLFGTIILDAIVDARETGPIAPITDPEAPAGRGAADGSAPAAGRRRPWRIPLATAALCVAAAIGAIVSWRSPAPSAPRLSIVVLPFVNLSKEPDQQYFVDALTEDVTTDLSRLDHVVVISSRTAFAYRNQAVDAKEVGRTLAVRYVLQGSIERSPAAVRVNLQLTDAETGTNLWAERFDRAAGDALSLQDEITGRIAHILHERLWDAEAARPVQHPDALDYLLRGRAAANRWPQPDDYVEAITLFERALALDSHSVDAKTALAMVLTNRVLRGRSVNRESDLARAQQLADKVLAEAPSSAAAHYVEGQILRMRHRCAEAIPQFEAAIAASPNYADAYANLGWCRFLLGSFDGVIALQEKAIRLGARDPFLGTLYFRIGAVQLLRGQYDEAIVAFRKASINSAGGHTNPLEGCTYLAAAYALEGNLDLASGELAEARRLDKNGRFASVSRIREAVFQGRITLEAPPPSNIRTLFEATYFTGLRKAGLPEE